MKYLTYDDMMKIAGFLYENGYGEYGITVENEILSKEMLDKINEDIFYRYVKGDDKDAKPEYADIINVNINNIRFRYKLSEDAVQGG